MADLTVLDAVSTNALASKRGILQRLFALWFDALIYNQIWEDPRVDAEALALDADSRVLTISSGGCNALNYLLSDCELVTAVDINRHHIFLLELKLAAARYLPDHESFFQMFGIGRGEEIVANYDRYIAHHLNDEARYYWEGDGFVGALTGRRRISLFRGMGLYRRSRNARFLGMLQRFARLQGCAPEKLLTARSLDEQRSIFDSEIAPVFASPLLRIAAKLPATMFGLGIPPQQRDEMVNDSPDATFIDLCIARVRHLACDFPVRDNYFAWQALSRSCDVERRAAVPDYLKEENFETLRARVHRVSTGIGGVTDVIGEHPRGFFNSFVLLDAQDWMEERATTALWRQIVDRGAAGSRITFRTAAPESPLPSKLPTEILAKLDYDAAGSRRYWERDRSAIYGGFHLYVLR